MTPRRARQPVVDFGDYISDGLTTPTELQSLLQTAGYPDLRQTGAMDFETMAALMSFRAAHALPPTLDVDAQVMRAILDAQNAPPVGSTDVGAGAPVTVKVEWGASALVLAIVGYGLYRWSTAPAKKKKLKR